MTGFLGTWRKKKLTNDMQFPALSSTYGEAEQRGSLRVAFGLEGGEGGGVTLDRLRALPFHGIQLHRAHYAVLLR